jgi:hypothetical protein
MPLLGVLAILIPPIKGMGIFARAPKPKEDPVIRERVYVNMPEMPRSKLMSVATDVIAGRVVDMRPVFPDDGIGYTEVDIALTWSIVGADDEQLTVRFPGANDGRNLTMVQGAPQVFIGEDVVLLIDRDDENITSIVGMDYGVYRISVDEAGAEVVVGSHSSAVSMDHFLAELSKDWQAAQEGR